MKRAGLIGAGFFIFLSRLCEERSRSCEERSDEAGPFTLMLRQKIASSGFALLAMTLVFSLSCATPLK